MGMLARAQETLPSSGQREMLWRGKRHHLSRAQSRLLYAPRGCRGAPLRPPSQVPEARGGTARRRGEVISAEDVMTVTVPGAGLGIRILCTSDIFGRNKLSVSP